MKNESDSSHVVAGVAWYRPEQWQRLREISEDAANLEETYESWLSEAEKIMRERPLGNLRMEKVDVDVEQLLAWCNDQGLEVNSKSRAQYVAEKCRNHAS